MMAEVVVVVVTPSSSCFAIVMTSLKRSCQFFPGRGTSRHFLRRIGGGGTAATGTGSSALGGRLLLLHIFVEVKVGSH